MFLLSDVLTYIRRIITDDLLIDYVNRFVLTDLSARMQLFDLKTKYQFQTTPGLDQYNMPLYSIQTESGNQEISYLPVYQGFESPCFINGIQVPFYTQRQAFFNLWPSYIQQLNPCGYGNGTTGPYTLNVPFFPAIPGHIDMTGIIAIGDDPPQDPPFVSTFNTNVPAASVYSAIYFVATGQDGQNIVVADSGQFLEGNTGGDLYGLLMAPGAYPTGNSALSGGYSTTSNTINYNTGVATVIFNTAIPDGVPINAESYYYEQGIPRAILFYNNTITMRPPPNVQYLVELDAYLTPAAFLNSSQSLPFGYMSEYIARGAARKILADTGDVEQFAFYEPLFREQENLVWKRSQRIVTSTRTGTIFSETQNQTGYNYGQGVS